MKTVIYARYSSDRQNEQSIEGQLHECYAYAKTHGLTIVNEYIDRAISGKAAENREAFQQMILDSEHHTFDAVLVYRTDRFARNRYDSAIYKSKLKHNGVTVLYAKEHIPDGPEGILFESLLEGMAEYYSAELSQKLRRGMRENALKCKATGGNTPLGYKIGIDKHYEIDETTAPIVHKIFEMYSDGHTCVEICEHLNSIGVKTARGRAFTKHSLPTILRNKKYIGYYICNDICVENGVPAIIEPELFAAVQLRLESNHKHPQRKRAKAEYLLTGKLYCGNCECGIIGHSGTSQNGTKHYYYRCTNYRKCGMKAVHKEWLENIVVDETVRRILTPDMIEIIADRCVEISRADNYAHNEVESLKKQLKDTEKSINGVMNAIEQGIITKSTKSRLEELEAQKEKLEYEIEIAKNKVHVTTKDEIKFLLSKFVRETDQAFEEYSRDIIECFIHKVVLFEDKIVVAYNIGKSETELLLSEIVLPNGQTDGCYDCSPVDDLRPPSKSQ